MKYFVENYVDLPRAIRQPFWRLWHNLIIGFDKKKSELFLNYGYAGEAAEFSSFSLESADAAYKYAIQLYAHVARHHEFPGTDILEVGSGRGGGAYFFARYFKPKTYTALDINQKTVAFCNAHLKAPGLRFVQGEAEKLPFEAESFDAVVNVESARCYGDIPRFFAEVMRVLRPGGRFCFADMIKPADQKGLVEALERTGFEIVELKNILPNVVESLRQDTIQRKRVIDEGVPKFLRKAFYEFAGVEGSGRFRSFDTGAIGYWSISMRKPVQ